MFDLRPLHSRHLLRLSTNFPLPSGVSAAPQTRLKYPGPSSVDHTFRSRHPFYRCTTLYLSWLTSCDVPRGLESSLQNFFPQETRNSSLLFINDTPDPPPPVTVLFSQWISVSLPSRLLEGPLPTSPGRTTGRDTPRPASHSTPLFRKESLSTQKTVTFVRGRSGNRTIV